MNWDTIIGPGLAVFGSAVIGALCIVVKVLWGEIKAERATTKAVQAEYDAYKALIEKERIDTHREYAAKMELKDTAMLELLRQTNVKGALPGGT